MSKIKVVTDSSLTIEPELVEKYDITVVPLSVMIDGVVYSDNDMKEEGKFLNLMRNSKELPKTSQPPVGVFAEVYENLMKMVLSTLFQFTSRIHFRELLKQLVKGLTLLERT